MASSSSSPARTAARGAVGDGSGSTSSSPSGAVAPVDPVPAGETPESLWAEVQRLRALVGPSEDDYIQLRLDVLGARDAAFGAEMELGQARALISALHGEVDRLRRDHVWFRRTVVRRFIEFRGLARSSPRRAVQRLLGR